MKKLASVLLVLSLAACGKEAAAPPKSIPKPEASKPEPKGPASDPAGKYKCLKCSTSKEDYRTSDKKCPRCGEVLASEETPKPKTEPTGTPGKTSVSVGYACPEPNCKYTSARAGDTCLTHPSTVVKELWYACAACKVEKTEPGKCEKCQAELKRSLK